MPIRTLILMRHAKSDWADESLSDHERPLNKRGRRDAPRMAKWLSDQNLRPDVVLCSSAARTCETFDLMSAIWSPKPQVSMTDSLYLAAPEQILRTIRSDSMDASCVMVLAHNPGITSLAAQLAGQPMEMATAAATVFGVKVDDWGKLGVDTDATLIQTMRPKTLKDD